MHTCVGLPNWSYVKSGLSAALAPIGAPVKLRGCARACEKDGCAQPLREQAQSERAAICGRIRHLVRDSMATRAAETSARLCRTPASQGDGSAHCGRVQRQMPSVAARVHHTFQRARSERALQAASRGDHGVLRRAGLEAMGR